MSYRYFYITLRYCKKIKLMNIIHAVSSSRLVIGLINRYVKVGSFLAALLCPRCPYRIGSLWHSTRKKVPWW